MLDLLPETKAKPKTKKAVEKAPRNNALLIQWADGGDYRAMLDLTNARHMAYCAARGFDFWCVRERIPDVELQWQKFALLLKAFAQDYTYVVFLDADCLIADTSVDLRTALKPDSELGMAFGFVPGGEPPHYNVGAIYARNAPATVAYFKEVMDGMTEDKGGAFWWNNPTCEQTIANALLETPRHAGLCEQLTSRWNCVHGLMDTAGAVVVAWHGVPGSAEKLRQMAEFVQGI